MLSSEILSARFPDPVLDAQSVFRAVMDGLSRPGLVQTFVMPVQAPAPLTPELAALALTLFDPDTKIWLDEPLSAVPDIAQWLAFHTGAPLADAPEEADFALVADARRLPPLAGFALGSSEYPDRSTTLVMQMEALSGGVPLQLVGPGIKEAVEIAPLGLPGDFSAQWTDNRAAFPRGVDLLLVANGQLIGLPRTARIVSEG